MSLFQKLKNLIGKGHERTVKAKKNILLSIIYKGIGILIGFAYFPISLEYLGPAKFGVFLTLTSVIDWFAEFDIGIGNGLRNKMGEAIADGDHKKARAYVSTAYFAVGSIFSGASVVFIGVCFLLPWADLLQADPSWNNEIAIMAMLMFAAFAIDFVSRLVYQIFYALQRTAAISLFSLISKVSFLLLIIFLLYFTEQSLILFGAAKTFTFAAVPLIVGIYYFKNDFKQYRPSFKLAKRSLFKDIFSLGVQFFIIRMAMLVIHQTNNILIARLVSIEEVPAYEASYKYMSIFLTLFVIMTNQLWGASIEAYRKKDMEWMKNTVRTVVKIWFATILLSIIMILCSPFVFKIWLQGRIEIPLMLTVAVTISIAFTNWVNMFNLILNGTGKIRIQMYAWILASIINIPLSIFLAKTMGLGTIGIVLGTVFSMVPLIIISPIQVRKVLRLKDKGIWAK
ncbi:MAG: O-antigen/teichoic acid export membrane protein [Saprospiraceae bacterium]|jgi:O-antigen/teichoic acid export membrane protein